MKPVSEWTRKELEALPFRDAEKEDFTFLALVILPTRSKHDSGYRCMDFVAVTKDGPICRLSGCSDVIHVDGIGGYGLNWLETYGKCPNLVPPSGWSIDCLPKSGLLRMWPSSREMQCDGAYSSFEVFSVPRDKSK
jgi:hypothetical protein